MNSTTKFFLLFLLLAGVKAVAAQDFNYDRERWLQKAEKFKPELKETVIKPLSLVKIIKDSTAFQG